MNQLFSVCLIAAVLGLLSCNQEVAPAERPNIVIFITDDESWLERSAYGWSKLPTAHFDRVAEQGVLFTHGYTWRRPARRAALHC